MRMILLISGAYGQRVANNIAGRFASEIVSVYEFPMNTPHFIDDPESYIPEITCQADLAVAAGLAGDLNLVAATLAERSSCSSMIIESHSPGQLPEGLKGEADEILGGTAVFPVPFCSLEPVGDKYIDTFACEFGKPAMEIHGKDRISSVMVKRSAPCGSTYYIASELCGVSLKDAEVVAGEKLHNYPCLASMDIDPFFGDTHLHIAGYMTKEAVRRALGFSSRYAVVDPEICQGDECGFPCMDACPLVRLSHKTIQGDGQVKVDPFSCGACEKCVSKCPYGAIEILRSDMSR